MEEHAVHLKSRHKTGCRWLLLSLIVAASFSLQAQTLAEPPPLRAISGTIRQFPQIKGSGNVASLWQTLARQLEQGNTRLETLLNQFAMEPNEAKRVQLVQDIIYAWTEVTDKDPNSRGPAIGDARKLYALEALVGKKFNNVETGANPATAAADILLKTFAEHADKINEQLLQQTWLKEYYSAIKYSMGTKTQQLQSDFSGVLRHFDNQLKQDSVRATQGMALFIRNLQKLDPVMFNKHKDELSKLPLQRGT